MTKPKLFLLTLCCIFMQAGLSILMKYVFQTIDTNNCLYLAQLSCFGVMMGYAFAWQYVLKHLELSIANSMMSIVPVLTLVGGHVFFEEVITISNYAGIFVIVAGLIVISQSTKYKGVVSVL